MHHFWALVQQYQETCNHFMSSSSHIKVKTHMAFNFINGIYYTLYPLLRKRAVFFFFFNMIKMSNHQI